MAGVRAGNGEMQLKSEIIDCARESELRRALFLKTEIRHGLGPVDLIERNRYRGSDVKYFIIGRSRTPIGVGSKRNEFLRDFRRALVRGCGNLEKRMADVYLYVAF